MTRQRLVLLLVLLAAFFLRVWRLPELPPGLWYDEAYNGMDAAWLAGAGSYPVFFVGNNGREPMWHYLLFGAMDLLGQTTFTPRWLGAMAGFLTVPVIYRLALIFLAPLAPDRRRVRWLAVAAAGWLAVSWWHLMNSRAGFRPVLLPPLLMASLIFFWQGRQTDRWRNFALAGLFLGLAQYTYLPARLAPLILGGFALLRSLQAPVLLRRLWLGLVVTGLAALIVFLPLGNFYLQYPHAFSARTGDVAVAPATPVEFGEHLLQGVSLFLGAGHELYRHHLPGRAMLGWLEVPFFWLGLAALALTRRRRLPESQLLLLGLGVMWLPALLASPPIHALRPIGLLPFYYLIVTLGSCLAARWLVTSISSIARLASRWASAPAAAWLVAGVIGLNGLINSYDYFWRWARQPEVYQEYNGPLADVTRQLITLAESRDVLIPFHLFVHPTTRYLLGPAFQEVTGPPPALRRPLAMLIVPDNFQLLYVGNIPASPAMVLLTRDETGQGRVYVSRPPRADEQTALNELLASLQAGLEPLNDQLDRTVAQLAALPPSAGPLLAGLFDPQPLRTLSLAWGQDEPLVRLAGYEVTPELARPGGPVMLNLYWRSLTNQTFDHRLFLQVIDAAGQPVNQWEGAALQEDMYRWRPDGLLSSRHTLWIGSDIPPGPYLIRLGFFDQASGRRLPVRTGGAASEQNGVSEAAVGDQVQLGLFYVTSGNRDPRPPAVPLPATFGEAIQLLGVTLPFLPEGGAEITENVSPLTIDSSQLAIHNSLPVTFHWQALRPTGKPYTVFLQLLNDQNEVVASWDNQPYAGLYPTNLWSPGEVVVDTFRLPLPAAGLPPGAYRLLTGFYNVETGQRLPVTGGDWVQLAEFSPGTGD